MKVTCDRAALVEALNLVGAVVVTRTPKPVLLSVKLTADEDSLSLAATDLEVAIHLRVDQVEVQEPGEALILADKFSAIVRESVDPTITIETDAEAAHLRSADSHFKIFSQSVEEFPPVETFSGDADFEIDAGALVDIITKTSFATARETSRYAINGVLLEREGKKVSMIATDGRRLAVARSTCAEATGETSGSIIPTKALNLLMRLLDDPAERVRARIVDGQAHFATESATLTTRLVEGNFPPYNDVIPKEHDRKATFNTEVLTSGVRRASLLTNEESKGVRFSFNGEAMVLSSRAPEMGEAEVTVPLEGYTGEPIDIGFNPFFVTDVLKVVDAPEVTMEFKAPNKPGVLRAGSEFLYVVMPVSLG